MMKYELAISPSMTIASYDLNCYVTMTPAIKSFYSEFRISKKFIVSMNVLFSEYSC